MVSSKSPPALPRVHMLLVAGSLGPLLLGACTQAPGSTDAGGQASGTEGVGTGTGGTGSGGPGTSDTGPPPADAGGPALPPASLFVRTDGDDACDGRADAPGPAGGGSCALATIARAAEVAACGDVVAVRAGRYDEPPIVFEPGCGPDQPIEIRGDGPGATAWLAALVAVDPATCASEGAPGVVRCDLPDGALDPQGAWSPSWAFVQLDPGVVRFEDENGVEGDMTGPLALTWNTVGPSAMADAPGQAGVFDGAAYVHPWNGVAPSEAGIYATRGCGASSSNAAVELADGAVILRDLRIVSGCGAAVTLRGADQALSNVEVYTGTVTLASSSTDARLTDVWIRNAYRRPNDTAATAGGDAWSTNSQALSVWGSGFVLRNVETYAAREGAGFANGAHDGLVDGATFHGHHNHGFKVQDPDTRNLVFRDVLAYNSQEALFIECPQDLVFSHVTLPGGPVVVQGNPGGCTPARLAFVESVLCGITWFDYGGDTWSQPGGHVLRRNVYVGGDAACAGTIKHLVSGESFDLASWQGWADDPCADCVRDEGSLADTVAAAFVSFVFKSDVEGAGADFHPTDQAAGRDLGTAAEADGLDRDGTPRDGAPDAGCYEFVP